MDHAGSRAPWVMLAFLAIIGILLFTEHKAHALGALPYLLLLACPFLHLFMHGGHGHEHGSAQPKGEQGDGS